MIDPGLLLCWHELRRGGAGAAYRFALLRETPLDAPPTFDLVGDVDLLGTRASRRGFVHIAFDLAKSGFCHLRVRRSSPGKTRLSLTAIDLSTSIELDVWEDLPQLDGGRRSLRFGDVEHLLRPSPTDPTAAIQRLPIDLEAALYLQHLEVKAKDLLAASVARRLRFYAAAVRPIHERLADAMQNVLDRGELDPAARAIAADVVARHVPPRPITQKIRALRGRVARLAYRRCHGSRAAFVIGCDGAGKSSVTRAVADESDGAIEYLVGKQLYRRSLPFRAAYKLNKATINVPSERVDEWLNVAAFLAANRRLARTVSDGESSARLLLIDRSTEDFVYVGRKTISPRFSLLSRLLPTRRLSPHLPVVHFVVDHATLSSRKAEVPPDGHRRYDLDMLRRFVDSGPVDYLALSNAGAQAQAVATLRRHLAELGTDVAGSVRVTANGAAPSAPADSLVCIS